MGSEPKQHPRAARTPGGPRRSPPPPEDDAGTTASPESAGEEPPAEPAAEARTIVVESSRTTVIVTQLPRIDDYVEDLIDPEFGMQAAHETTRAAGKKLLDGFNGTLREMAASVAPKRRGGQDP